MSPTPPLHGLRVIEFSAFVAAPSAGLALAQLGAEVIRVDPPGGNIDIDRAPRNADGRSLYWANLNRGKRSVEINVRSAEGRALLQQLICAPGDGPAVFLTNLGVDGELSYAALAKQRPDLIMVQLSGSPDGSNAVDYTVNCAAGFPGLTGSGRDGPVNHVLPAWDVAAGQMLALAVLAAERHWRLSGQGQHVKLALSDVAMATAANLGYLADVELNGTRRRADGNFVYGAYGDSFATADGRHVMVVAITDRQWAALLRATGLQESLPKAAEALGHRLDSEDARYAARELISTALRPWFAARTLAAIGAAFTDRALLWGPYRDFVQMLAEDPRVSEANPMFRRTLHPGVGDVLTATTPLAFGGAAPLPPGIAPRLGEHTHAVLQQRLGLDDAALQALVRAGAIAGR
ncbi:MAG: CoA transferase [Rubrivivax sp.]|nr:CoA transferase [Rubrivivax sp.]